MNWLILKFNNLVKETAMKEILQEGLCMMSEIYLLRFPSSVQNKKG